ncbi:protein ELYS-like isoform X2 [Rhopilema esculentum]|uniref:protein ELYS-like isoform X2 n=1 Tax=Rhopilema esculentum TaxID=499914 RepID=UPI0031CDD95A
MRKLGVNRTSDLQPFPYNTQENLERSDTGSLVGSISCDGDLAYLARGTCLEIVNTCDGSRRSACNLGAVRDNIKINCLVEYFMENSRKLLLGLEVIGWKRNGLLCVFDLALAKVVRAIWLPQAVTAITAIGNVTDMDSKISNLSNEHSKGIVIVGCQGGQVLIIRIGKMKSYDHRNDLSLPADVEYIKLKEILKTKDLELKSSTNYCIDLSINFWSDGSFRYLDHKGKPLRVLRRGDVAVTSLLVLRQATLLVVGFNFGCFQIWNLQSLQPIYSSPYNPSAADVTHLVFQEPENDPRHCCYILVGRSPSTNTLLPTTLTLYQLVFGFKDIDPEQGFIYRELEGVCERFEHQLTSDSNHLVDSGSIGSRIIACSNLARDAKQYRLDHSTGGASEGECQHLDTTLSYIVWESPPEDKSHPSYHLGLFDINKWYHLQMPESVRDAMYGRMDPVCPFFAFYLLEEVAEVIRPDMLVDCYINPKDLSSFKCPIYPSLDQNFWPSSLAFKCTCLAERGIVKTEMLGLQRQILADLVSKGSDIFTEHYDLTSLCWSTGLISKINDLPSRSDDPQVKFECLMSIAIEHNVMSFIMGCLRDWSRGEITNAGSCLRSMLQWVWKRVIKAKSTLDEHYIALFYSEKSKVDSEIVQQLSNCTDELKRLVQILTALRETPVKITDEGSASIAVKLTVTTCIHRYAEAIMFFLRSGILPESKESKQLNFKSIEDIDDNHLFVHGYCKTIERKILENNSDDDFGWDGKYPPPSANTVCKCLLLDVPRDDVMNFLYYWILDAEDYLGIEKLAENASFSFDMPKTKKMVVEAFWEIDHKLLESGVEKLVEFGPESLPMAMNAVYHHGNKSLACSIYKAKEMLSPGDMDWKLCIRILVEQNAIYEAYNLQGKYRDSEIGFELFHYFLDECMHNGVMAKLFDLHLTEEDEEWLCQFLQEHEDPISKELLIMFCIKRHRYAEAIRLGADFEKSRQLNEKSSLFGDIPSRRAILHMSDQIILPMQRKLLHYPIATVNKGTLSIREVPRPQPLSASIVKRGPVTIASRSDTIFKILHSVEESRLTPQKVTSQESFNLPFVRSASKPLSTRRKRRDYSLVRPEAKVNAATTGRKSIIKPVIPDTSKSDVPIKRRKHLFYGAEAMKLLQTPPVIKDPLQLKQIRSHQTPASILKPSNKKFTTGKSARKRVVISDPNVSFSPVKIPDSPTQPPESPSFLTPEVFKHETKHEAKANNDKDDEESLPDNDDVKRNLSLDLEESKVEPPGDHVAEPVSPKEEDDGELTIKDEITSHDVVSKQAECSQTDDVTEAKLIKQDKQSNISPGDLIVDSTEGEDVYPEKANEELPHSAPYVLESETVTIVNTETEHEKETGTQDESILEVETETEETEETAKQSEKQEFEEEAEVAESSKIENNTNDDEKDGGHGKDDSPSFTLELEPEQLEDGEDTEPEVSINFKREGELVDPRLELSPELQFRPRVGAEANPGTSFEQKRNNNDVSMKASVKEEALVPDAMVCVEPESDTENNEEHNLLPCLKIEMPSLRKPVLSLTTPVSELSTPNFDLGPFNLNPFAPISTKDVDVTIENAPVSSDFTLPSLRNPVPQAAAVQGVLKEGRGNLRVYVDSIDITKEMRHMDSSFESQESSFLSSATDFDSKPLDFGYLTDEKGATPPKQAKTAPDISRVSTRRRGPEKPLEKNESTPVKARKSLSPTKQKRRSFQTPRRSPKDVGYTPPVTRLSAKKGTPVTVSGSVSRLQEIGENSLLSSSVSESPISFTPLSNSTKKKPRGRPKRYSLQSPMVSTTHGMTLRSRTKNTTPERV